ncbi:MAG TPA: hypothetical protein VFW01_01195 [bacterium]|nr:hypothetical protein [bacterium]
MTRVFTSLVLGATMILTTAAAFAENNSAVDLQPSRTRIEQPVAIKLGTALVSGAPSQSVGLWREQRLDNLDPHR